MNNESTYTGIKPYKMKRLSRNVAFWQIWKTAEYTTKTFVQLLYKLTTSLCLARFTNSEIKAMLAKWHAIHGFRMDPNGLDAIIKDQREFTRPLLRQWKRDEMRRYRARKALKASLVVAND